MDHFFNHPLSIKKSNRSHFETESFFRATNKTTMKIQTKRHSPGLLFLAFQLVVSSAFSQGSLTPPGAPTATMKSLAQIEPRTPISSAPFTITQAGSYYLATNVTAATSNAIFIAANQVTLDLNGFSISSTSPTPNGAGVMIASSRTNITIMNGSIVSGVKEAGGVFSGTGFESGVSFVVNYSDTNTLGFTVNARVVGVNVLGCLGTGILLTGTVESCRVHTAGGFGINAFTIRNSAALNCGGSAIAGRILSDCEGECIGSGDALIANSLAINCYGKSAGGNGINSSLIAQNCAGESTFAGAYGLYAAQSAENCYGKNLVGTGLRAASGINCRGFGSTTGTYIQESANNCFGDATNGVGLQCFGAASDCRGHSNNSVGLTASIANNCSGQCEGNAIGLQATVAIGCEGRCYGNTFGISASILNSCTYYRQTGTPGYAGTKYNMP